VQTGKKEFIQIDGTTLIAQHEVLRGRPRLPLKHAKLLRNSLAILILMVNQSWADSLVSFALPNIADREHQIKSDDYRGQVVYLDFWASWCAPCRETLPLVESLQSEFSEKAFIVIGVNVDSFPKDGRKLINDLGLTHLIASDSGWTLAKKMRLEGIPASLLIDKNGKIHTNLPKLNENNYDKIVSRIGMELIQ